MSTTIDSLQIEIQSNSATVSSGLDELAGALKKLKENGSIGVAVKNLSKLSEALKTLTPVASNAKKLNSIAESVTRLSQAGSFVKVINQLNKLAPAINSLNNVNITGIDSKIASLVSALSPLGTLKAGGINNIASGLVKLEKVNLDNIKFDDDKISAFVREVKKLDDAIGPLSTKMSTIGATFKAVNSSTSSASSGVSKFNGKINTTTLNLSSLITVARGWIDTLQPIIQFFSNVISQAIEWDGVAARFGRGFGEQAEEVYTWVKRLNTELGINVQQFMQYSSTFATMLTGFGVVQKDASNMALGYMELTYDIWAGYNDIYKSLDEAAQAVRSAIAGEVEPVRKAGFTIIESTLEQTAANHGLEISLEKATEAQKSYLRYLTLVDQAQSQGLVGTYARELSTAEGLTRTLSQQLKSLAQTFGSIFLPILVKVIPWIQALVELLGEAIVVIAKFFGIDIQPVDFSDATGGLGDVSDAANGATGSLDGTTGAIEDTVDALKDLKHATVGIDELNVISPPSNANSDGGLGDGIGDTGFEGIIGDMDSLWDESIFSGIQDQVDAIKEKFKEWLPVIELIGGALTALSLVSLIRNIGDALSSMNLLQKALASIAIATVEAVLVFKFADDYLETGNLLSLLGEAITTAVGSYLLYRTWGDKGLVVGIAISIVAQLAAITLNLAEGDVELSDPELWIQSAFTTALGGVAGGWLAYKGLIPMSKGKGVVLGLLATASITLAAITIGEISANGEVTTGSILTGLGSVLTAAGFGFMLGGVHGAIIGATVALAINIGGALIGTISTQAKEDMEADLKERFGNIELSGEMLDVYIDKVTAIPREVTIDKEVWNEELQDYEIQTVTVPVVAALELYDVGASTIDSIKEKIEATLANIDTMNLKIALGIEVEQGDYESAIDSFLTNAQNYLDQYYLNTSIALEILNGEVDLSSTLNSFYTTNSARLAELGTKLKNTISEAFVDGEWIPDKLNEARELQLEIQEILDYISDIEYRAQMENLKLSITGDSLTIDSFESVLSGAKDAIESRLQTLEEVKMSKLSVAIMEYDANIAEGMSEAEAKDIYNKTVADIEKEYQNGRIEVTYGTVEFGLDTLKEAFKSEIALAKKEGWFDYKETLNIVLDAVAFDVDIIDKGKGEIYTNIRTMMDGIRTSYEMEVSKVSPAIKQNLSELLDSMSPTMTDYNNIAQDSRKAGETVPQEIRKGLNDYKELEALTGSVDAINYMIGQQFSTDTTFLNTLATAKNAGASIDASVAEGLLNNLQYVTDEATGVVTGIKNSMTGEVIAVTPTLVENMEQLGVDLNAGLVSGAESGMKNNKKKWYEWAIWPWNWFKEKNEINSPSKLFERGGKYLTDGLTKGMSVTSLSSKLQEIWTKAKTWWNNSKGTLSSYVPSIGSIKDKLSSAWSTAKTWWSKSKGSLSTYTPSIGSIKSKLSSAWSTAKTWWNKSKGSMSYTPTIGSIKSKLSSAWNTAKSWWSKNVKLSIPSLSFKVTYTKTGLGTVKKAIVNALGLEGWPKLSFAKNGGIFDAGSLIWAGEAGAEIVANAGGGRTGVMNVNQMQEAVYEGVYAAMMAAMRGREDDGGQAVHVYLDSREITASVEKRQRERGASLMGTQVYSY